MSQQSIQAQVNEMTYFATWLAGAVFLLWVGKTFGGMEKKFINDVLNIATPKEIPVRIPQTKKAITITCPICGKVIEIPDYNAVTRSEALRRHVEKEHTSKVGWHPQALMIEGGEPIPWRDRHLVDPLPLPESALSVEYLPAIEVATGETRTDALLRKLKDGVQRIQSSDEFRNYLVAMSRFHDYSWNNQLLIMLQKPDATHVAGFNTWKELGRWVKKGETGIAIFAPVFSAREVMWVRRTDGATWRLQRLDKEWGIYREGRLVDRFKLRREAERQLREWGATEEKVGDVDPRFIVVYVFDLSQTEGKPLPEFAVPVLTGEMNEELFVKLKILMKQRGVTISFESRPYLDPGIKGQFTAPNEIWVRPEEPPAQQLKTLLHESAHYYSAGVFRIPRADAETIAESAAFVVGSHYGFDTGTRSFPYVALWAREEEVLEQNLNAIRNVANAMLEDFEKYGLAKFYGETVSALPAVGLKYVAIPDAGDTTFKEEEVVSPVQMMATIPGDDLRRIADKYGWWAARLAEAVCPHNDVACVEREARRLAEVRKARLE